MTVNRRLAHRPQIRGYARGATSEPMTPTAPCLFALQTSRSWGEAVAAELGIELAPLEERSYEDGEHKARPLASVRGRDVFVLQSLYGDAAQGVNEKLCRLLFFIGALKDASAGSVTAVVPYLPYARKDRKTKVRDPVTTRYVAALFEAVGTDRVVTLDVHNLAAYQNAFRCRTEHLEAAGMFARHFATRLDGRPTVVVSPGAADMRRTEQFRQRLASTLRRPVAAAFADDDAAEGTMGNERMVGDVAGRCAIVIDDMIGAGTTIAQTVRACRAGGATEVYAAATHGLFVGDAASVLAEPGLDGMVVTDSVPPFRLPPGPVRDKLQVLPTAALFAAAISRMHAGASLTELLEG
jgi:ribose-phosphate pyrophosphokinase